jgi:hypothetical protein
MTQRGGGAVAFAILLLTTVLVAPTRAAEEQDRKSFESERFKLHVTYPATWGPVAAAMPEGVLLGLVPATGKLAKSDPRPLILLIGTEAADSGPLGSLEDAAAAYLKSRRQAIPDLKVIKTSDARLGNVPARRVEAEYRLNNKLMRRCVFSQSGVKG